jgi:SAM-dependent methyltransferase
MIEQARRNLASLGNVSFGIEDAQSLTFPDRSFDAVTCGLGMMFFPDPAQAVAEFHRVLRPGGYAAISAHPSASRTLVLRVLAAIDRHVRPQKAPSGPVTFDGHEPRLRVLFETAGFRDVETATEVRTFPYPSFDAYFGAIELGASLVGQEYIAQPESVRTAVREDARASGRITSSSVKFRLARVWQWMIRDPKSPDLSPSRLAVRRVWPPPSRASRSRGSPIGPRHCAADSGQR